MQYLKDKDTIVLKIERGEEVLTTLLSFCEAQNIHTAQFSGIGAVKDLSCGYYSLEDKKYYFQSYDSLVELVSLTGNVALKEGKPFIHVHGVFTGTDNQAFGGHIEKMTAGIVVEISMKVMESTVTRQFDDYSGLFLLDCHE